MPPRPRPGFADMVGHRICYLAVLTACALFYLASGEWLPWVMLLAVLGLPWLSLLLSLPAMLRFRAEVDGPQSLPMGAPGQLQLMGSSDYPLPPFQGKIWLKQCISGESRRYQAGQGLPTKHCGGFAVTGKNVRVCDYLGLFSFPVRRSGEKRIVVRPMPLPMEKMPELNRYIACSWRPKSGGGFAENHELRLYRPGDRLNQVHWKLSAKTGKLTLREPMLPQRGLVLLTMTIRGTPEELDRKFGRLLWLGRFLLQQGIPFEIRALTADGVRSLPVTEEQALNKAIDILLCSGAASRGSIREHCYAAAWQYHIGGDADEI